MSQLNIHLTPSLEQDLNKFMRLRKIPTKAEAIRTALRESLEKLQQKKKQADFSSWLGLAKKPLPYKKRKFSSDDALW